MRERLSRETLLLLKKIEEETDAILKEAEDELKSLSPQLRMELFGTSDIPSFDLDDPEWKEMFPLGSEESEEEF